MLSHILIKIQVANGKLVPQTIFHVFQKLSKYAYIWPFWFLLSLSNIKFRSALAVLSDQLRDQSNETALDDWYNRKIGRVKANRISQEFLDDAKMKATSMNFEQTRVLLEGYHKCKSKSKKMENTLYIWHFLFYYDQSLARVLRSWWNLAWWFL
jgi:hypothetical protein